MSGLDPLLPSDDEVLTAEKKRRIARAIAKLIFDDLQRERRLKEWQRNRK